MKTTCQSQVNQNQGARRSVVCALASATALLMLGACNESAPLQPLQQVLESAKPTYGVNFSFCTDPAFEQKQYLKTIVILDHSGSNQENYLMASDGSGAPALVNGTVIIDPKYATDPTGQTRYGTPTTPGTLLNYLSTLPANDPNDPQRFFSLIDFNDQATTYPDAGVGFTSDIPDFYSHVLADATAGGTHPIDGGSTSYLSALNKAYSIISADVQTAAKCAALTVGSASPGAWCPVPGKPNASSYVIVFMSDGSPITNLDGVGIDGSGNVVVTGTITITKESATDILGEVNAITALASNTKYVSSINLFTIYYYYPGNVDQSGQTLLANMAKAGNGIAYNALSGSNINYSQFQPPAKRIKYSLADVFVTNASVTWWNDGKLHLDTDMDGLPDDVEQAWGSDPKKASTDGNGVSDLVKYQLSNGAACSKMGTNGVCADPIVNYASGKCSTVKSRKVSGSVVFQSSDPGGLNDCEKLLLNDLGGVGAADSNGDSIPDWLEFKNSLAFQTGTVPSITTVSQDGYSLYQKIKLSMPLNSSTTQIQNYTPAVYTLKQISSNDTQDCYSLNVSNLPTIGDGNTVRIDVLETSPLLSNKPLYRVGKKQFAPGSQSIQFADWNDATEQTAGTWSISQ